MISNGTAKEVTESNYTLYKLSLILLLTSNILEGRRYLMEVCLLSVWIQLVSILEEANLHLYTVALTNMSSFLIYF